MRAVIHVKTDPEIKISAQQAARDLGLSLSDVINAALQNFIRTRTVVFSDAPRMTPEFERLLGPIIDDIKHKRNLSPAFESAEEMDEYLDSLK